jgi:Ca-activated chloride channel family protein
MDFAAPGYFWLLLLIPPVLASGLLAGRHSFRVRRAFTDRVTARDRWLMAGRMLAASLAMLSLVMAVAGPRVWAWRAGDPRVGLVLAVGIDVSKSMLAEDVGEGGKVPPLSPASRLDAAGDLAVRLFEELGGEKAGLFFFARSGIEVVAPTRDQGFLRYMVRHTNLADLTESGSDLAVAMQMGADMVASGNDRPAGAIVLISDGEDTENRLPDLIRQADILKARQLPVFTVGIGLPIETLLPIRRPGLPGIQGFYTDNRGDYLKTRLEERPLREIAAATGGVFRRYEDASANHLARALLEQVARLTPRAPEAIPEERGLIDLSPVFLGTGLFLFIGSRFP